MKRNALLAGLLMVGTIAAGGATWFSGQSSAPVGEGKTVHVMRTPT